MGGWSSAIIVLEKHLFCHDITSQRRDVELAELMASFLIIDHHHQQPGQVEPNFVSENKIEFHASAGHQVPPKQSSHLKQKRSYCSKRKDHSRTLSLHFVFYTNAFI